LVICIFGIAPFTSRAQHTKHEVEIAIAFDGQLPLVRNKDQLGFFTNPFIGRFQYQALTNGVQSLSVFLETVSETRTRDDLYSSSPRAPFNAQIAESVHLTSLGLEMVRTLLVAGDLRIAGGIDIGFGLGRPTLDVTNKTNDSTEHVESLSTWDGLFAAAIIRGRYTIVRSENWDVGLLLTGRYWAFLTIGPLGEATDIYNGPPFRSVHDLGYLFGVSVGF
jgi:hypothetical protein